MTLPNAQIRTYPAPRCFLCSAKGDILYRGLKDQLFGAPGQWNMRRCPDMDCGVLWLDPMPLPEDIGLAYQAYYTHAETKRHRNPYLQRMVDLVRSGYLARQYGYPSNENKMVEGLLGLLIRLHPTRRTSLDFDVMYLPHKPSGRLLEIGCGGGKLLEFLQSLGWTAQGIDSDPNAVSNARNKGLKVLLGTLQSQCYPDNSFDAIVMSHVIEHIPDPEELLRDCYRILCDHGQLTVTTPNAKSLGHRVFKSAWRGLEPPRHLRVFTSSALNLLAEKAGFRRRKVLVTTRGAQDIYLASRIIKRGSTLPQRNTFELMRAGAFHLMELGIGLLWKDVGEEIVMIAWK
jgi:2-polyprenyl-3-methyl-5-hydroxy-6-metoxy-1,4-benzoquinol methylase